MKTKKWRALDHCDDNKKTEDATVTQTANQQSKTRQASEEWIIIKDSEGVDVTTTDTQAAASLELGIQAAIAAVINISIADSSKADQVLQDFNQVFRSRQSNRQKTIVEKSKYVEITTVDTAVAVNLQILIQLLVGIVASLDIL